MPLYQVEVTEKALGHEAAKKHAEIKSMVK